MLRILLISARNRLKINLINSRKRKKLKIKLLKKVKLCLKEIYKPKQRVKLQLISLKPLRR